MRGEFELIARLARRLPSPQRPGVVGIGDDCAALPLAGGGVQLLTCDVAMAGQHFIPGRTPMAAVGWRVATASVSDVAACGGLPETALVSLGLPPDQDEAGLDALYDGLAEAATHYGFDVVGGNVSRAAALMVDLFMLGRAPHLVPRSGATPGDLILLSGPTGQEEAGRLALDEGAPLTHPLVRCHLRPLARSDLAERIAQQASACIDVSDGLASELGHLATASGVCLQVRSELLPRTKALEDWARARNADALPWVLGGGEGYQLLLTSAPRHRQDWEAQGCTVIGEVVKGDGAAPRAGADALEPGSANVLLDGEPLAATGWNHLQQPSR